MNMFDGIVKTFLHRKVLALKDIEISQWLNTQGNTCSVEDVRHAGRILNPGLFRLSINRNDSITLHLQPTIDICGAFLSGQCDFKTKSCDKLHICRHIGDCKNRKCHFPHDFTRGKNFAIVRRLNCENVNAILLVELIRLNIHLNRQVDSARPSPSSDDRVISNQQLSKVNDVNRQIDVCYPSSSITKNIDIELISLQLQTSNVHIEKLVNENEDDYFHLCTIQLEHMIDVDRILRSPKLTIDNVDVKFKRTKQLVDQTSFLLKVVLNDKHSRIGEAKLKLYINLLVRVDSPFTITNIATMDEEQIHLINFSRDIDFNEVRRQHSAKSTLDGKDISLIQIYQCDTVSIRYNDTNKRMNRGDVEQLIQHVRDSVFAYQFMDEYTVEVKFISWSAYREWSSIATQLQNRFQIAATPIIDPVDDEETSVETVSASVENAPLTTDSSQIVKITLRSDWEMVAAHPVFQVEYKEYICNALGGEIEIHNNEVIYKGNIPRLPKPTSKEAILTNKTNNYMQLFKYQKLRNLKPHHINILRSQARRIAFSRKEGNDYLVAAKPSDLFEIRKLLFPRTDHRPPTDQRNSEKNPVLDSSRGSSPRSLISGVSSVRRMSASPPPPLMSTTSTFGQMASEQNCTHSFPLTMKQHISVFAIEGFEDRLKGRLQDMFHVNMILERSSTKEKTKDEKQNITIHITGSNNDVRAASTYLMNLFTSVCERTFNDRDHGKWTTLEEAVDIIQHHLRQNGLLCLCEKVSANAIRVLHFDVTHPQFGVEAQIIDDLINKDFNSATIPYVPQSPTAKFTKEWTSLKESVRRRADYKKNICFHDADNNVYLFGLLNLVKELHQKFDLLKKRYIPQPCPIQLTPTQLAFLHYVAKNELNKLERQYKEDGCEINLIRLKQHQDFLAPIDMHAKITQSLQALVQLEETKLEILEPVFQTLFGSQPATLSAIVKQKCYFEKNSRKHRIKIFVPKSLVQPIDVEDPQQQRSAAASASLASTVQIGKSTVKIVTGDLTAQAVDAIVVCSTSEYLRKAVLAKAGTQVAAEYGTESNQGQKTIVTSNGTLPCKIIIFIPCDVSQPIGPSLKTSLCSFVAAAVKYSVANGLNTIAFPSVGCGKFGADPAIVAQHMIDEAQAQLISSKTPMTITFVLLSDQKNVYDEFVKYLNTLQASESTTPKSTSRTSSAHASSINYDEKFVDITLYGTNTNNLNRCKQEILDQCRLCLTEKQLSNKHDMTDWSQETIDKYYKYCLKQYVIPRLDLNTHTVELTGLKDAVHEAEKYFYELTTETLKQAHIRAVSRGVIWSVEALPNSNNWEQYSFKLNGLIEEAYTKKLQIYDFTNDKQEQCYILFNTMEEQHDTNKRRIRRKVIDSALPKTWEQSNQNCKQFPVQETSAEYQDALGKFNATMQRKYTKIVKIERIQNERWYKQYAAHRDEFEQRYGQVNERLLFHGCPEKSALEIIQQCFNRSFAGVNGVVYGCGVYFHTDANYSHSYAAPNSSGERTMFLARVLIGKTTIGNSSMKVPPPGHDTTSDGKNIFVVYHDAGAYADYLITYR